MKASAILAGAFVFSGLDVHGAQAASGSATSLAAELFAEADWPACLAESLRSATTPPIPADVRLYGLLASLRMNSDTRGDVEALLASHPDLSDSLRSRACYELARLDASRDEPEAAYRHLKAAFVSAGPDLLPDVIAALRALLAQSPELIRDDPQLRLALATCAGALPAPGRDALAPRPKTPSAGERLLTWPPRAMISFYRAQISPAIGQRCSLDPSCSQYARQALHTHGLLGVALMADRAVREPSVVAEGKASIREGGPRPLYPDPLSAHDAWMDSPEDP